MRLVEIGLAEAKVFEPEVFADSRGFFLESWNARKYAEFGLDASFVQDNHSRSRRGAIRGIHYQLVRPQGKLARVVSGRAWDVVIDLRRSSPTFGRWAGVELSAENKRQLWVPAGFGHGFVALEDNTDFLYKCTEYHAPEHERVILWSDPALGIEWPLEGTEPIVSKKDARGAPLAGAEVYQ